MPNLFNATCEGISEGLKTWEPTLQTIKNEILETRKNNQNRSIKQILGHMVDSVSNNTHRIIHLQYQESPFIFPNYATNGNNDRWIAIQNYQEENWSDLIQLWKYTHIHFVHVIKNINENKLEQQWDSQSEDGLVSLQNMVIDFLRHFHLHLQEIKELIEDE